MQYVWHWSENKHRAPLHPLLLSLTPETLFILFICWPGCLVLVSLFVVCCFLGKKKKKSVQWGIKCGDSQISSLLMVVFCPIMLPISSHPDSRRSRTKQKRSQKTEAGEEKKVNSVRWSQVWKNYFLPHGSVEKSMARFRFHSRRALALCVWSCCGDRDGNTQTNINVTDRPHRPLLWNFYFTHHLEISHKCSAECISSYWGYLHMNVHYIYSIFLLLNQTAPLFPPELPKGDAILPLACLH